MYHRSLGLHVNHLLFLHTYTLSVFLLLHTVPLPAPLAALPPMAFFAALCAYTLFLDAWRGAPYCLLLVYLAWVAGQWSAGVWLDDAAQSLLPWAPLRPVLLLLCILSSFALQLTGHAMFEIFQAPAIALHGFFAAPPLEWFALLARLGLLPRSVLDRVWHRVSAIRTGRE